MRAVAVPGCRALKVEADAQRAVEREKQREMLKDLKERSKADKEKQKQVGAGDDWSMHMSLALPHACPGRGRCVRCE